MTRIARYIGGETGETEKVFLREYWIVLVPVNCKRGMG